MYTKKIRIVYRPEMALSTENKNFSKSPMKPKYFIKYLQKTVDVNELFIIDGDWKPFNKVDFEMVHSPVYVHDFFNGKQPLCESNGLDWSSEFADTVRYTNASLYNVIKISVEHPEQICCSPTSGFHHAEYGEGGGFCTFSGQVLASLKIYQEKGLRGAYIDLDGHFGNSIESYRTRKDLGKFINKAIPMNINPKGSGNAYIKNLTEQLALLKTEILNHNIDYVVWCHGADSCKEDPLGHQCTVNQWLLCTEIFVDFVKNVNQHRSTVLPITTALFGGYQKDFNKVLELHKQDLMIISESLCH